MHGGAAQVLDTRTLNRALLDRQLLLRRSDLSPLAAIEHLVGLQAQAPNPPYIGLWTRLADFRHEDLSQLITDRRAVRIALMRCTIHLVSADDCLRLRPLLQAAIERAMAGQFGRQTSGIDPGEIADVARQLLQERPLTFAELGKAMSEHWPHRDPAALAQSARCLLPLVQVPPRGLWGVSGQAAHTTAQTWLGRPLRDVPQPDDTVLRYLAAFGPASVKDLQKWSGLTRLGEVVTRLHPKLRRYRDQTGTELFDLVGAAPLPDADTEVPVRFLPEYDNILLSHADRTRIMDEAHRPAVFTNNGIIRSTILVDGFVRGLWRITRERTSATLEIEPFSRLATADIEALTQEGARLLAFAAADSDTREVVLSQ
ncbi:winged helix DNA-binding domain-containing protein [Plantactinospora sonchi]|uniref:Winged helix DNA-binding domain-containing protein n=1 Tax=Plantactinospora sonchi TaxID=1544735 RepID=A0ABU7RUS0_9ACTN